MHRTFAAASATLALGLAAGIAMYLTGALSASKAAPDSVLATGFAAALGDHDTSWSTTPANVWLSGLGAPSAAFGKALNVGDLITIAGTDGRPQAIEITALEQIDASSIGLGEAKLQLVTGRQTLTPAGRVVRFLFAIDPATEPAAQPRRVERVL